MKYTLELYQFMSRLGYGQLPQPNVEDIAALDSADDDAIDEENDREFCRFEIAFPEVSGGYNRLSLAAQEHTSEDIPQTDQEDDPTWVKIENGVEEMFNVYASRLKDLNAVNGPDAFDDPGAIVCRYADFIASTGSLDKDSRSTLLPTSADDLKVEVTWRTRINKLIEDWRLRDLPSLATELAAEVTREKHDSGEQNHLDRLYTFLASHHCGVDEHKALLQLSGFNSHAGEDVTYNMFLSCCRSTVTSNIDMENWHKATCVLESKEPPSHAVKTKIDVCSQVLNARKYYIPLSLSFNRTDLWLTSSTRMRNSLKHLSAIETDGERESLETLLGRGDLHVSDLDDKLKKFSLALRLVSSLHQLYPGPWIQQNWSSAYVQIIRLQESIPIETLEEAYISCQLNETRKGNGMLLTMSEQVQDTDARRRFFLSVAQLLVDLAKGEQSHRRYNDEGTQSWYDFLVKEIKGVFGDTLLSSYKEAIEGCLFFGIYYDSERRTILDVKKRAQTVINRRIVRHLKRNLSLWTQPKFFGVDSDNDEDDREHDQKPPPLYGRTRMPAVRKSTKAGILLQESSSRKSGFRDYIPSKFTLWSEEDDEYAQRNSAGSASPAGASANEYSFTSQMKRFIGNYIDTLPEPVEEAGLVRNVRVAVIDTGLNDADEGDQFLQHPDTQSRIIKRKNFFSPNTEEPNFTDWEDQHGRGTHVARLVLKNAPRAELLIAKISNSRSLEETHTKQLLKALQWAGEYADIINLSFGVGVMQDPRLENEIERLVVQERKLIFAAASNSGGNGSRPWPANQPGVFCIHATDERGSPRLGTNPTPLQTVENFATLGHNIESYWKGHYRSVSGTSFATPIAAAIAANVLEFTRQMLPSTIADEFRRYRVMSTLFRHHMTDNSGSGHYHYIKPWKEKLFDHVSSREEICRELCRISALLYPQDK